MFGGLSPAASGAFLILVLYGVGTMMDPDIQGGAREVAIRRRVVRDPTFPFGVIPIVVGGWLMFHDPRPAACRCDAAELPGAVRRAGPLSFSVRRRGYGMDATRERAYRFLLSAGLLHVKWDLAGLYGGFSRLPWRFRRQARSARRAAHRAAAFHNLAIFAARDFEGFSEDRFWHELAQFSRDFPESGWSNYPGLVEAFLRGEPVNVIQPGGGVPADVESGQRLDCARDVRIATDTEPRP